MSLDKESLYRLPWSKHDNAGGWVEVTDECDLLCPGCYRHRLEGHRPLDEVKADILLCRKLNNCDRMAVAGGEPLLYPNILEVIAFIHSHGMKPVLLTNGEKLSRELAAEFKKAGLAKYHFHVDSGQQRPGFERKNESEMNELRQHFADLVWEIGGVHCGYNITVTRQNLEHLPGVVEWARRNLHKVQHVSLVAYRAIPIDPRIEYLVKGNTVDVSRFQHSTFDENEIDITSREMFALLEEHFNDYRASSYLSGTADPETLKFLITMNLGTAQSLLGILGPKSVRLAQKAYRRLQGRYCAFIGKKSAGKKVFLLAAFDNEVRQALSHYVRTLFRRPQTLWDKIYIQSISLQQPNEYLQGKANLCDGCMNMMIYQGRLIHSCRLDEYRMFGGLIFPEEKQNADEKTVDGGPAHSTK
jgi:hypothetical protein